MRVIRSSSKPSRICRLSRSQRFVGSIYMIAGLSLTMFMTQYAVLSLMISKSSFLPEVDAFTTNVYFSNLSQRKDNDYDTCIFAATLPSHGRNKVRSRGRGTRNVNKGKNTGPNFGANSYRANHHNSRKRRFTDRFTYYNSTAIREQWRQDDADIQLLTGGMSMSDTKEQTYVDIAKKHYFAQQKMKNTELKSVRKMYQQAIKDIMNEEDEHCVHARLAVSTLVLALLLQRMQNVKGTRSVFNNFFHAAVIENREKDCACSAKVLQAYSLFEMSQGHSMKSLQLVTRAVRMDETLKPAVLGLEEVSI